MRVMIAFDIEACRRTIKDKQNVLFRPLIFLLCSIHALINFGDMKTQVHKHLELAFSHNLGSPTTFNEEVAIQQDL